MHPTARNMLRASAVNTFKLLGSKTPARTKSTDSTSKETDPAIKEADPKTEHIDSVTKNDDPELSDINLIGHYKLGGKVFPASKAFETTSEKVGDSGILAILEKKKYPADEHTASSSNHTGSETVADMATDEHMQAAVNADANSSNVENPDINMPDAGTPAPDMTPADLIPRIVPSGSQPRVYMNNKVVPHVMEAMKNLSLNQPEKPIKWLSEFLAARSKEVERE